MLSFVKQATGLGLTLAEIKEIIAIRRGGGPSCAHVHRLLYLRSLKPGSGAPGGHTGH